MKVSINIPGDIYLSESIVILSPAVLHKLFLYYVQKK